MKTIPRPFSENGNNFNTLPRPVNIGLAFCTEGHKEEEKENRNTSVLELAWTNYRNEKEVTQEMDVKEGSRTEGNGQP